MPRSEGEPTERADGLALPSALLGPQQEAWCPPSLGRVAFFPESTGSKAGLIWKHAPRHTQKCCCTGYPGSP